MRASELLKKLTELVEVHGDLPVMVFIKDEGSYDVTPPKFDTDGAGDECFML